MRRRPVPSVARNPTLPIFFFFCPVFSPLRCYSSRLNWTPMLVVTGFEQHKGADDCSIIATTMS